MPSLLKAALVGIALAGGCANGSADPHIAQIQALQDKLERQGRLLAAKEEQLQAQAQVVQHLRRLEGERSLDRLTHVSRIKLERLSGGYDDDHDGVDEGVVVYVQLIDQDGDVIKASGSIRVQLWDLANPEGERLVGEAALEPEALRPLWYGKLMTSHYTVKVPWAGGATRARHKSITVVVRFVELLSGRVFEAQTVVDVTGVGAC